MRSTSGAGYGGPRRALLGGGKGREPCYENVLPAVGAPQGSVSALGSGDGAGNDLEAERLDAFNEPADRLRGGRGGLRVSVRGRITQDVEDRDEHLTADGDD